MISDVIDLWALIHLFFFAFVASSIHARWRPHVAIHLLWWAPLSFGWELAEHFLQRAYPAIWGGVVEHWANAWIADPLANLIGVVVGVAVAEWSHNRL